jgi:hypothetical protein
LEIRVRGLVVDVAVIHGRRRHARDAVDDEALRAGLLIVLPPLRGADLDVVAHHLLVARAN